MRVCSDEKAPPPQHALALPCQNAVGKDGPPAGGKHRAGIRLVGAKHCWLQVYAGLKTQAVSFPKQKT